MVPDSHAYRDQQAVLAHDPMLPIATGMRRASHWFLAGMRITVIGKGNIGGTLGSKWRAAGHEVVYGARGGSGEGPGGAPVRSIGDALKEADVVVLAVPGQAVPDVVNEHGAALAGKVVIDAVNRMGAPQPDSRELIEAAAPSARYVRAFSTLGWENFAEPLPGANLFFAADPEARAVAEELISAIELERLPRRYNRDCDGRCPAAAVVCPGQAERRQPQDRAAHRPLTLAHRQLAYAWAVPDTGQRRAYAHVGAHAGTERLPWSGKKRFHWSSRACSLRAASLGGTSTPKSW